jgi:hypothetical protein
VNDHLVGDAGQLTRQALYAFNEERRVRHARPLRAPGTARKCVWARVDGDRERAWLGAGAVQDVAAVAGADVHEDLAEHGG